VSANESVGLPVRKNSLRGETNESEPAHRWISPSENLRAKPSNQLQTVANGQHVIQQPFNQPPNQSGRTNIPDATMPNASLGPRTLFDLAPMSHPVQLASHAERISKELVPEKMVGGERANRDSSAAGSWRDRSASRDRSTSSASKTAEPPRLVIGSGEQLDNDTAQPVHRARYQTQQAAEPPATLGLPPALDLLPQVPKVLDDPTLSMPPSRKPGRSLLDVEPESLPPSPFPGLKKSKSDQDLDDSPSDMNEPPPLKKRDDLDEAPRPPRRFDRSSVDCDAVRNLAKEWDITKIRVDSSADYVVGYKSKDRGSANTKEGFIASAPIRPWLNYDGQLVVEGKLIDLRLGSAVIERSDGTRISYLMHKLSDADQAYISESWGLPITCSIDDRSFPSRDFINTTVTWKASGACHKPLYFEDVQLERYGHEWGPIVQPVLSTVHFFGDVAVLPYKMGIHPMNECQYALGYYRPGSCAPWTVGPVPISLRGALLQANVVTGTALILP